MTTTDTDRSTGPVLLTPAVAGAFGFAVYVLSVAAGIVFDLNADADDAQFKLSEWVPTALIALVGLGIAVWAARKAQAATPSGETRTALALAVVAAGTVLVFWAGWSSIFGAVAVGLALEHRRRVGSSGATAGIAMLLGAAAFVTGAGLCIFG